MSDAPRLAHSRSSRSGLLGRAVVAELAASATTSSLPSKSGAIRIDIADPASIVAWPRTAGPLWTPISLRRRQR